MSAHPHRTRGGWAAALLCMAAACATADAPVPAWQPPNGAGGAGAAPPGSAAGSGNDDNLPQDCSKPTLAPRRIWRLTPKQYDNTLKDLLGVDSSYGTGFPADEVGVGFSNASDALLMTPLLADKLDSAAEDISAKADLQRFIGCGQQRDDNCLRDFVSRLGERTFRRPLTAAETQRYFTLAKAAGDFDAGTRLTLQAMLQSPYFLYRFELGTPGQGANAGRYELDDYEIASELSYLLWQSMPDDALFNAAKAHQLRDPAQLAQQLARMLQSERARPVVRGFVFDWLGLSTIDSVPKDSMRYPELTTDIRTAMIHEAEQFVDHVMFGQGPDQNGSIAALLNSPTTYLNAALAKFYGVSPPSAAGVGQDGFGAVTLPDQQRRGVLTLGGVLLTHSRSNDSSPIHRGKLVRERMLCQQLPPPPPGLVLQPPGLDPAKTARERYADHSSNAFCNNCHKLMDPIGYAFEHFDGIGRYRADDNGHPIDVSGTVVPNDPGVFPPTDADGDFMGTDGLVDKLEVSQTAERCYALEWFRFAYGEGKTERDGAAYPSCEAKAFQAAAAQTPGSLSDMLGLVTRSDWFLARSGPSTPPPPVMVEAPPPATDAGAPAAPTNPAATGNDLPMGLSMEQTVNNDWGMGYCYTYQLKNVSSAAITWSVVLDVRGTMNQHWECNTSGDSGRVTFTGADHNQTLMPGTNTQFGFCGQTSN